MNTPNKQTIRKEAGEALYELGKAQAISEFKEKLKKEILKKRRYLPSKESIGTMDYWLGDNDENRGIYVDLGGIIGEIEKTAQEIK